MWLEEENKQDPYNRTNTSPSVGAGGGGTQVGGTASNPSTLAPVQTNQPQQNFATVQDYLGANKQQGEDLGRKFTSSLSDTATNEKGAIDTAAGQAKSDISAGTTSYDPTLSATAVNNPTAITNSPDQLSSYLKQWNAAYTGPTSFESSTSYAPAASAANEAANKAGELGTTGGQQQLLQDQFGVYGQGNKGLDQAVLQNSSFYPEVQGQQKEFGTVQDYLTKQAGDVNTQATKAAADTAAAQTQTRNAVAGKLTDFQSDLEKRTEAARTAATPIANQIKQDLASGDINKITADLQKSGLSGSDLQNYLTSLNKDYGVTPDVSGAYNYNPNTDITTANIATPQDYANSAAWQQLTGQNYAGVLNPNQIAQAGKTSSPTQINPGTITPQIQAQLKQYDTELSQKTNLADAADKTKSINVVDPKNFADISGNQLAAQKLIDAAQRMGLQKSPGQTTWLDTLRHQAAVALAGATDNGRAVNDKTLAGLNTFVAMLDTYLQGKPQYTPYTPIPIPKNQVVGIPQQTYTDPVTGQVKTAV